MKSLVLAFFAASISGAAAQYITVDVQIGGLLPGLAGDVPEDRHEAREKLKRMAAESAAPGRDEARAEFNKAVVSLLESDATPEEAKVWLARQLQLVGDGSTIPALGKLLKGSNGRLREEARLALEKIPGGGAVLRTALESGKGGVDFRIGLANSVGELRDADAVEALAGLLGNGDIRAVRAAATALGKIATPGAKNALFTVLDNSAYEGARKGAVARGLLEAAESTKDMQFLSALASIDLPGAISAAAASAEVGLQPDLAPKLLMDALVNHRPERATAVIAAIEALPDGRTILEGGLEHYARALEGNRLVFLEAMGRNGVTRSMSRLLEALNSGDAVHEQVAVRGLANIGNAQALRALFVFAQEAGRTRRRAVVDAIAETSAAVEPPLKSIASNEENEWRSLAVEALVARGDRSAGALYLNALSSKEKDLRAAGADGLGKLGGAGDLPALIVMLKAGNREAAVAVLGIARGTSDPAKVTAALKDGLASVSGEAHSSLLAAVAAAGAPSGLALLSAAATEPGENQDGAIRALAKWPSPEAIGPLSVVAAEKGATDAQHKIVMDALARLLRLEESGSKPERAKMAAELVGVGRNPGVQRVMISVLGSIRDKAARKALEKLATDPGLKADAEQALENIGKR